ncbi:MAG: acyl-CoA dehydrogenase family protein [Ottowia sp.]|nr:acyl-CoA dehydrogenase family protein [Ottowia sp.]
MTGVHPDNQVPQLQDYNVYTSDPALQREVARGGGQWRDAELVQQGAEYGSADTLQAATDANHYLPELHAFSATGARIDQVQFHPAWHKMMAMARRNGNAGLPFFEPRKGAWSAWAASLYMHCQIESGSSCPTTMTRACVPVLQQNAALWQVLQPLLASTEYDARDIPLADKKSITVGMGMTEKQGGSDLRTNTTRAVPHGEGDWGQEFLLTGHKWFFSAPMCDGHLVLARTDEHGISCFFVPRWRPDGSKNPVHILRLKDKVGDRSNSSSEVEFHDAWGVLVGEEGRGIRTIIGMAAHTRLDCAVSSAGFMRQGFVQALHYARERHAFGKALADQPMMTALLADMALESEAAMLLALDLAARFGSDAELDRAWCRFMTPLAKFWNCKRAVGFMGEAMEVFGGNGYVETVSIGRLFRQAPVNSIWEGSGNVMGLDLLRAVARNPEHMQLILDDLQQTASQDKTVSAQLQGLRDMVQLPPAELERQGRRFTQKLALALQACLMLRHASAEAASAFIASRYDPDWGPVTGITCGTDDAARLLQAAWAD